MARILILDTATKQCSVALSEHGHAVAWKEERTDGYVPRRTAHAPHRRPA